MGHTPFGYKMDNGLIVIDDVKSSQLRKMFDLYLDGMSFSAIAIVLDLTTSHSGIKRMLLNKKYLGDNYYPALIAKETFDKVPTEIQRRAVALGRLNRTSKIKETIIPSAFTVGNIKESFDDPFRQAEYIYSLIESEVSDG